MLINLDKLIEICKADTMDMYEYPSKYFHFDNSKVEVNLSKGYVYVDNGADILAVAHMDTVEDIYHTNVPPLGADVEVRKVGLIDWELTTIQLDDRLGVYIIAELLPRLGIKTDILLTIDEEIGASTASLFETDKKYNWMFQFDRHGYGTVVMYQYHTKSHEARLERLGYGVEIGSFSDICSLSHLGCTGFNFGVGYEDEHTMQCRTRLSWIQVCISMFYDFYEHYKDKKFPYDKPKVSHQPRWNKFNTGTTSMSGYKPWEYTNEVASENNGRCFYCKTKLFSDEALDGICSECMDVIDKNEVPKNMHETKLLSVDEGQSMCDICGLYFADEDLSASQAISQGALICNDCRRALDIQD